MVTLLPNFTMNMWFRVRGAFFPMARMSLGERKTSSVSNGQFGWLSAPWDAANWPTVCCPPCGLFSCGHSPPQDLPVQLDLCEASRPPCRAARRRNTLHFGGSCEMRQPSARIYAAGGLQQSSLLESQTLHPFVALRSSNKIFQEITPNCSHELGHLMRPF